MRPSLNEIANGRWPGILRHFGVDEHALTGRHGPCPVCGGRDRFRFDDKDGRGTFFCSHCGAGDGAELIMKLTGRGFRDVATEITAIIGTVPATRPATDRDDAEKIAALRRVWSEARPVQRGDDVDRYLRGRGIELDEYPLALRTHPSLPYYDAGHLIGRFPAMVARVVAPDGSGATIHRTYLDDGRKAPVPSPKKLMPGRPITGAAVRLFEGVDCVGVAEGIETALAAYLLTGVPTWAAISANGLEAFVSPEGIKRVIVFSDKDESYTGQAAGYALAKRLRSRGIEVEVRVPAAVGDWNDDLVATKPAGTTNATWMTTDINRVEKNAPRADLVAKRGVDE